MFERRVTFEAAHPERVAEEQAALARMSWKDEVDDIYRRRELARVQGGERAVAAAQPLSGNGYKVRLARVALKRAVLRAMGEAGCWLIAFGVEHLVVRGLPLEVHAGA